MCLFFVQSIHITSFKRHCVYIYYCSFATFLKSPGTVAVGRIDATRGWDTCATRTEDAGLFPCCSPGQGAGSWHCSSCQQRTEDCRTLCLCPNVPVSGSAHTAFTLYYTIFSHRFLAHLMLVPRRKTGFPTRIDSFKIRSIINYFNFKV